LPADVVGSTTRSSPTILTLKSFQVADTPFFFFKRPDCKQVHKVSREKTCIEMDQRVLAITRHRAGVYSGRNAFLHQPQVLLGSWATRRLHTTRRRVNLNSSPGRAEIPAALPPKATTTCYVVLWPAPRAGCSLAEGWTGVSRHAVRRASERSDADEHLALVLSFEKLRKQRGTDGQVAAARASDRSCDAEKRATEARRGERRTSEVSKLSRSGTPSCRAASMNALMFSRWGKGMVDVEMRFTMLGCSAFASSQSRTPLLSVSIRGPAAGLPAASLIHARACC